MGTWPAWNHSAVLESYLRGRDSGAGDRSAPALLGTKGASGELSRLRNLDKVTPSKVPLRVCVVTQHIIRSSLDDDLELVIPGAPLARALAAAGHNVTILFILNPADERARADVWKAAWAQEGIELQVLHNSRHYYLPVYGKWSFEVYAWLHDRHLANLPPFDAVHFHDSHGLAYYSGLAKHQHSPKSGLLKTRLIVSVAVPHVWLITAGGGGGLKTLDDMEVNFMESESARLADAVFLSSEQVLRWCTARSWRFSGPVLLTEDLLPSALTGVLHEAVASGEGAATEGGPVGGGSAAAVEGGLRGAGAPAPGGPSGGLLSTGGLELPDEPPPLLAPEEVAERGAEAARQAAAPRPDAQRAGSGQPAAHVDSALGAADPGLTADADAGLEGTQIVIVIDGQGGGALGGGVSSGRRSTKTEMTEEDFDPVAADVRWACQVADHLLQLRAPAALPTLVFALLGELPGAGTSPAEALIREAAHARRWGLAWRVARMSTAEALRHAAGGEVRALLLPALHFRDARTPRLLRRALCSPRLLPLAAARGEAARLVARLAAEHRGEAAAEHLVLGPSPAAAAAALLRPALPRPAPLTRAAAARCLADGEAMLRWYSHLARDTDSYLRPLSAITPFGEAARTQFVPPPPPPAPPPAGAGARAADVGACLAGAGAFPAAGAGCTGGGRGEAPEAARDPGWRVRHRRELLRGAEAAVGGRAGEQSDVRRARAAHAERIARKVVALVVAQNMGKPLVDAGGWSGLALPVVTVVITHYKRLGLVRHAIQSIVAQDYPCFKLQLVVVDDGSPDPEVPAGLTALEHDFQFAQRGWVLLREPNRYLGGARNAGARAAAGKYILFMDDDNAAKPHEVSSFVRAMEHTGLDAMTSFVDFVWGEDAPNNEGEKSWTSGDEASAGFASGKQTSPAFVFLGGSADVGIFKNCFGDANSFYRADFFRRIGGYTEDRNLGYEDWELYSRIALAGYMMEVNPEALYFYRFTSGSMQKSVSYSASRQRALRAYLELGDRDLTRRIAGETL